MSNGSSKTAMAAPFVFLRQRLHKVLEGWRRIQAFAAVQAKLAERLPASTVVLGPAQIYGTGRIRCGEGLLIYPYQYWETQEHGEISIGDGVVLSTGVHLVAYAGILIGKGTMVGEYTSVRDANHMRDASKTLRDAGHSAKPIVIGSEVWIGRGVTVLSGVTIGDGATIGANAVVTRDVPAGIVVAGVPAVPIQRRTPQPMELPQ